MTWRDGNPPWPVAEAKPVSVSLIDQATSAVHRRLRGTAGLWRWSCRWRSGNGRPGAKATSRSSSRARRCATRVLTSHAVLIRRVRSICELPARHQCRVGVEQATPGTRRWFAGWRHIDEDRVFLSVVTLAELERGIALLVDGAKRARRAASRAATSVRSRRSRVLDVRGPDIALSGDASAPNVSGRPADRRRSGRFFAATSRCTRAPRS